MAAEGGHIDFMFLGPPLTRPLDPLLVIVNEAKKPVNLDCPMEMNCIPETINAVTPPSLCNHVQIFLYFASGFGRANPAAIWISAIPVATKPRIACTVAY